jgi:hypothetical protein
VLEMLESRKKNVVIYDGKKVAITKDALVMVLSTEYSKYNANKVMLDMSNDK